MPQEPESDARTARQAPESAAEQLEFVVRARSALWKDAEPLDGLAFEVLRVGGASLAVTGVFGQEVVVDTAGVVASGVTDAQGLARVVLPADVGLDERGAPNVVVRVSDARFQERTARPRLPRGGGMPEALLIAQRGATARGRVLDARGEPVHARVVARRWYDLPEGRQLRDVVSAQELPHGAFELHLREDLFGVHLFAEAEGVGTAAFASVDLQLAAPPQDLRLVVVGDGALRGRVEDEGGRPVAGLQLLVRLAELDAGPGNALEPAHSLRRAEGRGWTEVLTSTDGAGRFDVRGLRPEPYLVRANVRDDLPFGHGTLLTDRPVLAEDADVVLRLAHPHLVVRLLDAAGAQWSGTAAKVGRDSMRTRGHQAWPERPQVLVYPCTPAGSDPEVRGEALSGREVEPHLVSFAVESGTRYLVRVRGEAYTAPARVVEVPPAGGRVDVDVRAAAATAWGVVRPRIDTLGIAGDYEISLEDLSTGLRVCEIDAPLGAQPEQRVPAGRYRVVVEGVASRDFWHGTVWTERALGRAEVEVDVPADARVEVPIAIGEGARIDLELVGEPNAADREAAQRLDPWNPEELSETSATAWVVLQRPQRGVEQVFRLIELSSVSSAGKHLAAHWPLGRRETSQVVSPGAWTLVARLPGGRVVSADVVLRAGETTRVRLEFAP